MKIKLLSSIIHVIAEEHVAHTESGKIIGHYIKGLSVSTIGSVFNSANSRMYWGRITFTYFSTSLITIATMMMTMIMSAKHPPQAPAQTLKPMINPCDNPRSDQRREKEREGESGRGGKREG